MKKNPSLFVVQGTTVTHDSPPKKRRISVDTSTGLISDVQSSTGENETKPDFTLGENEYLFPGLLDIHIHAREDATGLQNHKETYQSALDASANGGVVCVCAMPNTPRPLVDLNEYNWHRKKTASLNHPVHCLNYFGVGVDTEPVESGNYFYKVYTGPSVGELFFRDEVELENALRKYEGRNLSFHVEDFDVLEKNSKQPSHDLRRPPACVLRALEYLLPLIEKYSIQAKLCHWSLGGQSLHMVERHRNRMANLNLGFNTTLEVSPMHLLFNAEELSENPEFWPYVQMNPAIQSRRDQADLIQALKDGVINYLATDHAPHTLEEKFAHFAPYRNQYGGTTNEETYLAMLAENKELCRKTALLNGVSGAPWLDTYALVLAELKERHGFTMENLAAIASKNPADFVNPYLEDKFGKGYGKIEPGYKAAFTVLDFGKTFQVCRKKLRTRCGWSPLEGKTFGLRISGILVNDRFIPSHQNRA